MSQPRAVIVGAGIAGLASAIALQNAGWRVALLERGERLRGDGTALLMHQNALRALDALGLTTAIAAAAEPVESGRIRRADGQLLVDLTGGFASSDAKTVVIHRNDLFEALVAALGSSVEIHTGVTATHIDLVRCAAGDSSRRWSADVVIGADGIGSAVRAAMGQSARVVNAGTVAFRAVVPPHRAPDVTGGGETQGPAGRRFLYASLGARGVYWAAVVRGGLRPEPAAARRALVRRWFGDWHEPIPELIDSALDGEVVQQEIAYLSPLPSAFSRVTDDSGAVVVGDAAHAMTPDLGQGAGMALEDAVTLGWCLSQSGVVAGLREYEQLRRSRTVRVARISQKLGSFLGAHGKLSAVMRDGLLRVVPESLVAKGLSVATDWRPPQSS